MVGAAIGFLAGQVMAGAGRTIMVENVLVGVFGSFVGGDVVAGWLSHGKTNDTDFQISSLGLAVAGAVVFIALLRLMRKRVGPIKQSKGPPRRGP